MKTLKADLVVIGAGSGGLSVASGAAQLGLRVVLFERGEMGGDCLNTGCVPSKALIAAGKRAHQMRTSAAFGIANVAPLVDWPAVRAHVQSVIATIAPIDSQERFEGLGCTVVREHARFVGPSTVRSDSVTVHARRIVLATGGRAAIPDIAGIGDGPVLTNESIFHIETLPSHLVVLGAGPIGMELGQAFRRLGAQVTVIEPSSPLSRFDPELAAVALQGLEHEGVALKRGVRTERVVHGADGIHLTLSNGEMLTASHVLAAAGRRPNVEGLDLEAAGIAYGPRGVQTDETLRTTNPRVWAVGDVAGREQLTHAAGWHASVFVRRVLFRAGGSVASAPMPAAVYTDPELAHVGLTEAEARARFGNRVSVSRWRFEENDRAQAERSTEGLVKLVLGANGRILGCGIVGEGAGDLLQIAGLAMANGLKARALTAQIAPYPTRGEAVKRAASAHFAPLVFGPRARALVGFLNRLP